MHRCKIHKIDFQKINERLKKVSKYKWAEFTKNYLFKSDSVIKMLSQSLLTVMINVYGNRIDKIFLNNVIFNHLIWDFFCPVRRRSDVFSYTSSNIGTGFTQLATSPHVPVTEKEFRSFYFGWNYGRLNSHLGKFIFYSTKSYFWMHFFTC